jgi:hypothetical protein
MLVTVQFHKQQTLIADSMSGFHSIRTPYIYINLECSYACSDSTSFQNTVYLERILITHRTQSTRHAAVTITFTVQITNVSERSATLPASMKKQHSHFGNVPLPIRLIQKILNTVMKTLKFYTGQVK